MTMKKRESSAPILTSRITMMNSNTSISHSSRCSSNTVTIATKITRSPEETFRASLKKREATMTTQRRDTSREGCGGGQSQVRSRTTTHHPPEATTTTKTTTEEEVAVEVLVALTIEGREAVARKVSTVRTTTGEVVGTINTKIATIIVIWGEMTVITTPWTLALGRIAWVASSRAQVKWITGKTLPHPISRRALIQCLTFKASLLRCWLNWLLNSNSNWEISRRPCLPCKWGTIQPSFSSTWLSINNSNRNSPPLKEQTAQEDRMLTLCRPCSMGLLLSSLNFRAPSFNSSSPRNKHHSNSPSPS